MTTDPGDLVLDPTCGSGTTAYVVEQWGRRWITMDTRSVALALARARLIGARYPWHILADSRDGQLKEAEVTRSLPSSTPTYNRLRHGFVCNRVPHITLKSIANNAEIDTIWEAFQNKLEPLRAALNEALGKAWEEWEIPREGGGEGHQPSRRRGDEGGGCLGDGRQGGARRGSGGSGRMTLLYASTFASLSANGAASSRIRQ